MEQNKVRLNEKIGIPLFILMFLAMFYNIFNPSLYHFLLIPLLGFSSLIFLSFWGLTTFNDKYGN